MDVPFNLKAEMARSVLTSEAHFKAACENGMESVRKTLEDANMTAKNLP
jgi:uncharacterized protein YegP (UPF0339 family)